MVIQAVLFAVPAGAQYRNMVLSRASLYFPNLPSGLYQQALSV